MAAARAFEFSPNFPLELHLQDGGNKRQEVMVRFLLGIMAMKGPQEQEALCFPFPSSTVSKAPAKAGSGPKLSRCWVGMSVGVGFSSPHSDEKQT